MGYNAAENYHAELVRRLTCEISSIDKNAEFALTRAMALFTKILITVGDHIKSKRGAHPALPGLKSELDKKTAAEFAKLDENKLQYSSEIEKISAFRLIVLLRDNVAHPLQMKHGPVNTEKEFVGVRLQDPDNDNIYIELKRSDMARIAESLSEAFQRHYLMAHPQ